MVMLFLSFISKCCVIFVGAWPVLTIKRGSGRACVPASAPQEGASIVSGAGEGSNKMFAHGSTSFSGENAAARTFGRAHRRRPYHSKHTSPFRKGENKSFNACGASANVKTKNLVLAELPQMIKQKIWRLRSFRKWQNKKFGACGASANDKTKNLMLAELPQMTKQKIWCLRSFRK